jgi:hypothetical protein
MNICVYIDTIIVLFLTCLILVRWFLPNLNESKHSQLLAYISIAADMVDISSYIQDSSLDDYYHLIKAVEGVLGLSLIQFSFSLTAKKKRNPNLKGFRNFIDLLFATQAWAVFLQLISQDFPSFIVRIFIIQMMNETKANLIFFVLKNGLLVLLEIYRIIVVIRKQLRNEK